MIFYYSSFNSEFGADGAKVVKCFYVFVAVSAAAFLLKFTDLIFLLPCSDLQSAVEKFLYFSDFGTTPVSKFATDICIFWIVLRFSYRMASTAEPPSKCMSKIFPMFLSQF